MRSTARARSNYSLLTLFVLAGTVASHVVHEIASSSCGIVRRVYKGHDLVRFASNFLSPEPTFCSGNPNFVTNLTMAPANFCSATRLSDGSFDQFLLEAVVLTRWHSSTREFSEKVVLAPSPFFECSINASVEEPVWRTSWQLFGKRPPPFGAKHFEIHYSFVTRSDRVPIVLEKTSTQLRTQTTIRAAMGSRHFRLR